MTNKMVSGLLRPVLICVLSTSASIYAQQAADTSPQNQSIDVTARLALPSNLHFRGHPASLEALIVSFPFGPETGLGWGIPTTVDRPAFARNGIHIEEIVLGTLEAGQVSRRSSLRFVLDTCGVSYYVSSGHMIVTTKDVARAEWIKKSTRPSIDMLRAEELTDRREAVFNSGFWHLDSALWVGPLSTLLADPDRQISFDAAFALGEFGPEASDAIAALLTLLRSEDPPRRDAATYALGKIASSSWAKVLELVDDPIPAISHAAVTAIGRMGSAGNEALPTLIACGVKYAERESSYDEYERCKICDSIGSAISQVERGDAIPQLFALLRSDSSGVRAFAAFAVGQIGSSGQICEPELQKLLADTSVRVRRNAAYAMSRLNLPSDTDTKALESASEDSDRTVKLWAKEALRVIRSEK